jgi:hypothetical protein
MSVMKYGLSGTALVQRCGICTQEQEVVRVRLGAGDTVPDREPNQARKMPNAQLLHHAAAVSVDARRRNPKTSSNFLACATGDDEFQNFALAPAQPLQRVAPRLCCRVDKSEHRARPVRGVPSQHQALARP